MSIISKLIASDLDKDFAVIAESAPEDRQVQVTAAVMKYQELVPTAFENVSLADVTELEIIDELAPAVAAGLVVLEMLGEEGDSALVTALREQAQISELPLEEAQALVQIPEAAESFDDGED